MYAQQGTKPAWQGDINAKFSHLRMAQLRECNFHTARRQTRMAGRHQHKIFASPHGTATPTQFARSKDQQGANRVAGRHQRDIFGSPRGTASPNAIHVEPSLHTFVKPAWQEDINTKFSHLRLAQLPRTQFTHRKAPNSHGRKTSTQNFRISAWHSYPKRSLHTARRQTRMAGRHQHKILRISARHSYPERGLHTARHGRKTSAQNSLHFRTAQLPRTWFTHSKAPNPNGRKTSTQNYRIPAQHSRMEFTHSKAPNLNAGRHQHNIFASPHGTATQNAIYTQQGAKPEWQEDINTKFSHLRLAQLPRTQFTHRKAPNSHGRKTSTQNFRISAQRSYPKLAVYTQQGAKPAWQEDINTKFFASQHGTATRNAIYTQATRQTRMAGRHQQHFRISAWHSYPKRDLHTARRQKAGRHQHKIFASQHGTATRNAIYTQQRPKPEWQEHITAKFSHLCMAKLPRTQFTHNKAPKPNGRKTRHFRISARHSFPERNSCRTQLTHIRQTRVAGRHQHQIFASTHGTATPTAIYTQQGP